MPDTELITIEDFISEHGLEMEAQRAFKIPDSANPVHRDKSGMVSWLVTIKTPPRKMMRANDTIPGMRGFHYDAYWDKKKYTEVFEPIEYTTYFHHGVLWFPSRYRDSRFPEGMSMEYKRPLRSGQINSKEGYSGEILEYRKLAAQGRLNEWAIRRWIACTWCWKQPGLEDVLPGLGTDASLVDDFSLDEFAAELGIETPTAAYATYEACKETREALLDLLGSDAYETLLYEVERD